MSEDESETIKNQDELNPSDQLSLDAVGANNAEDLITSEPISEPVNQEADEQPLESSKVKQPEKPGGDIVQNKKTFLVLKALAVANNEDKQLLQQLYTDKTIGSDNKIATVLAIFNKYQIRKLAEDTMEQYYQSAIAAFEAVNIPVERKAALAGLIESVFKRTH